MKILLTVNKTLTNGKETWLDGATWNLYEPFQDLGHEVYFYDTVNPVERSFTKVVDSFKPDLIFCCLTYDPRIAPHEPWEELEKYTKSGLVKTFNWFCDDTWRFENFSKHACHHFTVCSTPEIEYIEKFKTEADYENIILGLWHSNIDYYPPQKVSKKYDVLFCGHLNQDRGAYLNYLHSRGIKVDHFHGLEHKDMLQRIAEARIGINFSKNFNGLAPTLQMKGRMFEVPAARSLLLTEYTPHLEEHYVIDKEIVAFKTPFEMYEKARALLQNPKVIDSIANKGYKRFIKDHESHVRLANVLEEIDRL